MSQSSDMTRRGSRAKDDRSVASVQLDGRQVAGDLDAAVSGVDIDPALAVVDMTDPSPVCERQIAVHFGRADGPVAGVQIEPAGHALDP